MVWVSGRQVVLCISIPTVHKWGHTIKPCWWISLRFGEQWRPHIWQGERRVIWETNQGIVLWWFLLSINYIVDIIHGYGWLYVLSLKFRLHRATRTPHHQHNIEVIHGIEWSLQHSRRVKNYTKIERHFTSVRCARMRGIRTCCARLSARRATVHIKSRASANTAH